MHVSAMANVSTAESNRLEIRLVICINPFVLICENSAMYILIYTYLA